MLEGLLIDTNHFFVAFDISVVRRTKTQKSHDDFLKDIKMSNFKQFHDENGELIALVIGSRFEKDGIEFFTPANFSQQLAYMYHDIGMVIPPHIHNRVDREVQLTQEVLFVRKGRVRVDLFDKKQKLLTSVTLESGDVILLASGGHGFTMLEPTEMIEVKQGPYLGDRDKTRFSPSHDD
jgi:mannose-6-phosphate isomerase-like protein (cupin superfamily)